MIDVYIIFIKKTMTLASLYEAPQLETLQGEESFSSFLNEVQKKANHKYQTEE